MALKSADRRPEKLVEWLEEKRVAEGLSQREFAAKLEVHESYWSYLRRGQRTADRSLVDRALRMYPDLALRYVADLTISKQNLPLDQKVPA